MSAILLFPPAADPAHPPLGIAALAGYLTQHGQDVTLIDLNVRAYNTLLSAPFLRECTIRLEQRLARLERRRSLAATDFAAYCAAAENVLSGEWLSGRIDDARRRVRDPALYASRRAYAETTSIVRRAMQLVSAAYHPASWTAGGFSMSHIATRSADVLAAIDDREQNPILPLFEAALPEIVRRQPNIVGISLNYRVQTIPAMTLAATIRRALPDTFLVVGGGMISFFEDQWAALAPFRHLVDGWIPFEGERPLLDLLTAIEDGTSLDKVAGLMRFDGDTPVYHPPGPPLAANEIPPPRFEGLPLADYLAPQTILPILSARGCYWGRCAFCSHGHLYRERYRATSGADVLATMRLLADRYSARVFYFVDEAIAPRVATRIADAITRERLLYEWFSEARFERQFDEATLARLHAGGCRMLLFGLESNVQRVLDLMDKGITPERVLEVLRACTAAGIRTFVMFFSGFPTETRAEAESTIRFIEEHRDVITHAVGGQFVLEPQSPVFRHREKFGITDVFPFAEDDLKTWSQYTVSEGLTPDEAAELAHEVERLPFMKQPDFHLISRSHLAFLPPVILSREDGEGPPELDAARASGRGSFAVFAAQDDSMMVPHRRDDLIPHVFRFKLDDVHARLREHDTAPLARNPTQYVFCPEREMLVDVGPDGVALLRACSGDYALGEILDAVGDEGRDPALQFFCDLAERRFIEWEVRA
jgi:hypothetical protein